MLKYPSMKQAVVYFSRAGGNWLSGERVQLKVGNTEQIACMIAHVLDCDLIRIIPKVPYSNDYDKCCDEAKADQDKEALPELYRNPSLKEYDVIYLGYPIYWESLPRCVVSLLKSQDFTNKIIYPFSTHEGSGLGSSLTEILNSAVGCKVLDPLPIPGSLVDLYKKKVERWVESHNQ